MPRKNRFPCSIEGCPGHRWAKGFCQKHYLRFTLYGDPHFVTPKGTHRESLRGNNTAEYQTWASMKRRCTVPGQRSYPHYGGRGIRVCDRWTNGEGELSGFECFLADMGRKPDPSFTIDRIDSNGNYEPANCRWATRQEQNRNTSRNRLVQYAGEMLPLTQAAEMAGLNPATVRNRINAGWDVARALSQPVVCRDHNPDNSKETPWPK